MNILRVSAAAIPGALAIIAAATLAAWWQPTTQGFALPSALMAVGAVALTGAIIALLARSAWLGSALQAGPLRSALPPCAGSPGAPSSSASSIPTLPVMPGPERHRRPRRPPDHTASCGCARAAVSS